MALTKNQGYGMFYDYLKTYAFIKHKRMRIYSTGIRNCRQNELIDFEIIYTEPDKSLVKHNIL